MHYLLRLSERGSEPHPQKRKLRDDVAAELKLRFGTVATLVDTGRLLIETSDDLRQGLMNIHGLVSYSRCEVCALDELKPKVAEFVRQQWAGVNSFAVKVKRVGSHSFRSTDLCRELGGVIIKEQPELVVNLNSPDKTLVVEIRHETCFLCDEIIVGLDAQPPQPVPRREEIAFVVDHMLGTLARKLRGLGYDTAYCKDTADTFLLRVAEQERRFLLTQDRELSIFGGDNALLVQSKQLDAQVTEVLNHLGLRVDPEKLLSRCIDCNGQLESIEKAATREIVPAVVFEQYDEFCRCDQCKKIYWKGTHHAQLVEQLITAAKRPESITQDNQNAGPEQQMLPQP